MRVTQTGKVDTTFGNYGFLIYDTELSSQLSSVTFNTDSNILVSGHVYTSPANADFFTARITPNGQFDTTFGLNGIIITPLTEYDDIAYDLAIQSDGKIIVAGTASENLNADFAVVRYIPGYITIPAYIDEIQNDNQFIVFPNPISDNQFTLQY
jgi:uncharacterized delta-60 repeat protein